MTKLLMDLCIYKIRVPLKNSYNLSFDSLNDFKTIVLNIKTEDKNIFGECTSLYGYSWEPYDEIWETAKNWILAANGSLLHLINIVNKNRLSHPFASSAFCVIFEKLLDEQKKITIKPIPIVGVITVDDVTTAGTQAHRLLKDGFKIIKVKAKGFPEKDLEIIQEIQETVKEKALLRIDANQGYTPTAIKSLFQGLDPEGIELFEQPLKKDQWAEMQQIAASSPVPLMLDEAIWTADDIKKTSRLQCAQYVKLKLFKHSSIKNTLYLINMAKDLGLNVVFGNGVQTEIGCLDEALIYSRSGIDSVSEINGFAKQRFSFFDYPLECNNGMLCIKNEPKIKESVLEKLSIDKLKVNLTNDMGSKIP